MLAKQSLWPPPLETESRNKRFYLSHTQMVIWRQDGTTNHISKT